MPHKNRRSIRKRGAHDPAMNRINEETQKSADCLRYGIKSRTVTIRPFISEARDRSINKARIKCAKARMRNADLIRHTGPEILYKHIGICK